MGPGIAWLRGELPSTKGIVLGTGDTGSQSALIPRSLRTGPRGFGVHLFRDSGKSQDSPAGVPCQAWAQAGARWVPGRHWAGAEWAPELAETAAPLDGSRCLKWDIGGHAPHS